MEFDRKQHYHSHLNIAPLVDVVFLLLIFFMLTSQLMDEPVIKIKLPASKTSDAQKNDITTIYITKEGYIFLSDKQIQLSGLQGAIKDKVKDADYNFIRIKADRASNVGILVSVIDEVRLAGIKNYSIVTEKN